jgi:hypothetical protein
MARSETWHGAKHGTERNMARSETWHGAKHGGSIVADAEPPRQPPQWFRLATCGARERLNFKHLQEHAARRAA